MRISFLPACAPALAMLLLAAPTHAVALRTHAAAAPRALAARPHDFDFGRRLEVNQAAMWMSNYGLFAQNDQAGGGLIFPRGTDKSAVVSAGLWLGGVPVPGDTFVTITNYTSEYGPGRLFGAGSWEDPYDPDNIVYKVNRWTGDPQDTALVYRSYAEMQADPTQDPLAHHSWSQYMAGAVPHGAPWRVYRLPDTTTPDPTDSVDVAGPAVLGDQMLWCVYNDGDPGLHATEGGQTAPLDIEVRQTAFAFAHVDSLANTIFLRYEIVDKNPDALSGALFSLWMDPDLGDPSDDLAGYDLASGLGYAYNGPGTDDYFYGVAAPAVGVDVFSAVVNADSLPALSFTTFLNGQDPLSAIQSYSLMSGYDRHGEPRIDPTTNQVTRFDFTGDPVLGTGWRDTLDLTLDLQDAFYISSGGPPPLYGVYFGGRYFGGGADVGWNFHELNDSGKPVSSLNPAEQPDSFPSIALVFSRTSTQYVYRYLRLEQSDGSPPATGRAYRYGGFRNVPFRAVNAITGEQYEVGYVEREVTDAAGNPLAPGFQPATFDSTWGPDASPTGGYEQIVIFNRPHSGFPSPAFAKDGVFTDTTRANRPPVLYALWPRKVDAQSTISDNDYFLFEFTIPFHDARTLSTYGPATLQNGDTLRVNAGIVVGQGQDHLGSVTSLRAFDSYSKRAVASGSVFLPVTSSPLDTLFTNRTDVGTTYSPTAVAAGDFDLDGKLDLVVASALTDTLEIRYGIGGGAFAPAVYLPSGPDVRAVAVGNLNADAYPDIVAVNGGDNTISVFYGSAGGFAPMANGRAVSPNPLRADFGTGSAPVAATIADVIGDASPDVVVANSGADSVSVFRGGPGGLTPDRADFGTGSAPTGVAVGDVNGDTFPDVLVTNSNDNTVTLLRNKLGGLDPLQPDRADFGTGSAPSAVVAASLNGDPLADAVVTNLGSSTISIRLGSGAGLSPDRADFGTGSLPVAVVVADLNADGFPDVATADRNGSTITVLHGRGDGTLADRTDYATGSNPAGLVVGDFDGDGHPDLLTPNTGSNSLTLYSNHDQTVPALAALIDAHAEGSRVRISWLASGGAGMQASVYRRESATAWARIGSVVADGSGRMEFEDPDVRPGARFAYRLGVVTGSREVLTSEVWVQVPDGLTLGFAPAANPHLGALDVSFTLPSTAPARLEMFDVRGRLVFMREVGAMGPGLHVLRLGGDHTFASGLYFLRLTQAKTRVQTRSVVLR